MNFSKHLAVVYTLIIAIPLLLIILGLSEYMRRSMYGSLENDARSFAEENRGYVASRIEQLERLESIVVSDYDLQRTFYFAGDSADEQMQLIETLNREIRTIERLQFAMPAIYGIHIYVANHSVPEKWPIVFSEDRVALSQRNRWTWNYTDPVMTNIAANRDPTACLTEELLLNRRHVGYLQISTKMTELFPFLYRERSEYNEDYVFSNGVSLVSTDSRAARILKRLSAVDAGVASGVFSIGSGADTRIVAFSRINRMNLDLTFAHAISPAIIQRSVFLLRLASILLLIASTALLFMIITFVTRKMVTRLYTVMDAMQLIRAGNLNVAIDVPGEDEVAQMAGAFTAMVERIQELVTQIKDEQKLVSETEIKAMQNQINAHFLYNVLETIKMQAELSNQHDIAKSVTLLGRMMRYCLKWRNTRVTLSQELDYSRDYIELMNIRNDYQIGLAISVDPALLDAEIPKMIIQPVIENAVIHGIEPRGEDSTISISAQSDPARPKLVITIRDSGVGMTAEECRLLVERLARNGEADTPVGGIGLYNIQKRLHAFYGSAWSIAITSEPGGGTVVSIPVPLER